MGPTWVWPVENKFFSLSHSHFVNCDPVLNMFKFFYMAIFTGAALAMRGY